MDIPTRYAAVLLLIKFVIFTLLVMTCAHLEGEGRVMAPQIVRTVEELAALDPETVVQRYDSVAGRWPRVESAADLLHAASHWSWSHCFPAVVIATGEQVRVARKALRSA